MPVLQTLVGESRRISIRSRLSGFSSFFLTFILLQFSCLATLGLATPGFAGQAVQACSLEQGDTVQVASIVDGDTLVLGDGREVRLVGLQAPKLGLGRQNFEDWPLAAEAKTRLGLMVFGRDIALSFGGRRQDRYGRLLAHLTVQDGSWIQARMIAAGLARVYSFSDNRACVNELLAYERDARLDQRGMWAIDEYAPKLAQDTQGLLQLENSFQLVEGRIKDIAIVGGRAFLNFGDDWKTDFTVTISPRDLRRFTDGVEIYENASVRVRGWMKSYNGPEIVATHPEQIELLAPHMPPS